MSAASRLCEFHKSRWAINTMLVGPVFMRFHCSLHLILLGEGVLRCFHVDKDFVQLVCAAAPYNCSCCLAVLIFYIRIGAVLHE